MNTTTTRYTPLESLLLFQSLLSHGVDPAAFLHISSLLQNSPLINGSSHYDARRLSPEALQELFLHLLREELEAESQNTEQPDGPGQSPNSRNRKLASPPLPTLQEARQHLGKLPLLVDKLYAGYRDHVVRQIKEDEERYDSLQGDIRDIEASDSAVESVKDENARPTLSSSAAQNGQSAVPATAVSGEVKLPNGVSAAAQVPQQPPPPLQPRPQPEYQQPSHPQVQSQPPPQPQPQPRVQQQQQPVARPQPQLQPQPQPQPQPQLRSSPSQLPNQARPQLAELPEGTRNGNVTPQPLPSPQERTGSATPPILTPQQAGALQNQPSRLAAPIPNPALRQQEQLRPQNGPPQVLQPPQGVGAPTLRQGPAPHRVQGEGLQRPEGIGRGKTSPAPLSTQPTVPGQLKWEPLYQPNQLPPQYRQAQAQAQLPQQRQPAGLQAPQGTQPSSQLPWTGPAPSPYGSPRPPQAQPGPPVGQPVQQSLQQQIQQPQQPVQQHAQQQTPQPQVLQQAQHHLLEKQAPEQVQQQRAQRAQQPQGQRPMHQDTQQTLPQPPPSTKKTGQYSPALQPAPAKTPADALHAPPPTRSPATGQAPGQDRSSQPPGAYATHAPVPGFQPPPQNRALAAASLTPPPGPAQGSISVQQQQQRRRTNQPIAQPPPPVVHPSGPPVAGASGDQAYAPHTAQGLPPRSAVPEHIMQQQPNRQHAGATTPTPSSQAGPVNVAPQTPVPPLRRSYLLGSGTSWKVDRTPSTPRADVGEVQSPAYEPLSPNLAPAVPPAAPPASSPLPPVSPARTSARMHDTGESVPSKEPQGSVSPAVSKRRGRPPRSVQKEAAPSLLSPAPPPATSQAAPSPKGPLQSTKDSESTLIKHEETTPQPPTEAGDTTADESVTGRRQASRAVKRKRRDTVSPTPVGRLETPGPPTHVLWTRSFNKVSHSAMEQIMGHRDANLFAHQIRERDAPGYRNRILMPQDLRSIRNAINHGNRAAAAAAAALPGGDPGTSNVLLPISEELVPPRGIVNSSQLDRELAHMLANAIMYNPDPSRGPGPAFMRSEAEVDAEDEENGAPVLGYKVDENGIVNNARAMFVEVEKLLSDLRAAEIQKGGPAAAGALTGTSTRQASVAGGLSETPAKRDEPGSSAAADDREEQTLTEPETGGTVSKRRRITRG